MDDKFGIFVYLAFMIGYGILKALKNKKAKGGNKPVGRQSQPPQTDNPQTSLDLEEILGELFGKTKTDGPARRVEVKEAEKEVREEQRERPQERSTGRRLFDREPETPAAFEGDEGRTESRYKMLNELGGQKAEKLNEMVKLDDRTRSNLAVVNLDDDEVPASHGELLKTLHDPAEFRKAFILSEIIRRKY